MLNVRKPKKFLYNFVMAVGLLVAAVFFIKAQEHKPLHYDVPVTARLVPLFALDSNGNPVYDLKQEELELYINGIKQEYVFYRYRFDSTEETEKKKEVTVPAVRRENRYVFVVMDSVFNSLNGYNRTKEITARLIEQAPKNDVFVVLEFSAEKGLHMVAGPVTAGKTLAAKIRALPQRNRFWNKNMHSDKLLYSNIIYDMMDPREDYLFKGAFGKMRSLRAASDKMFYQLSVKRFSALLKQFKYALRTITNPKIVFLISEGIARGAFIEKPVPPPPGGGGDTNDVVPGWTDTALDKTFRTPKAEAGLYSGFLLRYLKEVAKAVNRGGSVMYCINPKKIIDSNDPRSSGEMTVGYMAKESGGKYFEGSKIETIVKDVKRTTAAYYEIAFQPGAITGKNMKIEVRCKRKGVRVNTLHYAEKGNPYRNMKTLEKKLFALDIAKGGNWSRMVGTVKMLNPDHVTTISPPTIFQKKETQAATERSFEITIPDNLINKKVDIFLVQSDPKSNKSSILMKSKQLNEVETFNLKLKKGWYHWLVLVEPVSTFSIFSKF